MATAVPLSWGPAGVADPESSRSPRSVRADVGALVFGMNNLENTAYPAAVQMHVTGSRPDLYLAVSQPKTYKNGTPDRSNFSDYMPAKHVARRRAPPARRHIVVSNTFAVLERMDANDGEVAEGQSDDGIDGPVVLPVLTVDFSSRTDNSSRPMPAPQNTDQTRHAMIRTTERKGVRGTARDSVANPRDAPHDRVDAEIAGSCLEDWASIAKHARYRLSLGSRRGSNRGRAARAYVIGRRYDLVGAGLRRIAYRLSISQVGALHLASQHSLRSSGSRLEQLLQPTESPDPWDAASRAGGLPPDRANEIQQCVPQLDYSSGRMRVNWARSLPTSQFVDLREDCHPSWRP